MSSSDFLCFPLSYFICTDANQLNQWTRFPICFPPQCFQCLQMSRVLCSAKWRDANPDCRDTQWLHCNALFLYGAFVSVDNCFYFLTYMKWLRCYGDKLFVLEICKIDKQIEYETNTLLRVSTDKHTNLCVDTLRILYCQLGAIYFVFKMMCTCFAVFHPSDNKSQFIFWKRN